MYSIVATLYTVVSCCAFVGSLIKNILTYLLIFFIRSIANHIWLTHNLFSPIWFVLTVSCFTPVLCLLFLSGLRNIQIIYLTSKNLFNIQILI